MPYFGAPGRTTFAILLCLVASISLTGQEVTAFTGRVTAVSDGDVLTVVDGRRKAVRVRLAGIDAPEATQEFGQAAREFLAGMILGQPVTVVGRRTDTDGKLIAQVFLLGRDISYSMLWAGLAWYDKQFEDDQTKDDRKRYLEGEKFARDSKENIWSQAKPVPPWEYRKNQPEPVKAETQAATDPKLPDKPAENAATPPSTAAVEIVGNKQSKIYHWNPGCPGFSKIADQNRVPFRTRTEAEAAGYRPAKNCKTTTP